MWGVLVYVLKDDVSTESGKRTELDRALHFSCSIPAIPT